MADAPGGSRRSPVPWWREWMPWYDNAGRFSAFKLAVLILLFVPATMIAARCLDGALGPRPINAALHQIGNWTLRLLLISLAVRPARSILHWPRLIQLRRLIGIVAFGYAAVHLVVYAADEAFNLQKVAVEIVLRIYLTIGVAALLILAAMALTSTDGMVRRLGGRRWRRLHQLVYGAALLAVIHFFMQTKVNVDEPWVMAGLFAWLMGYRAATWYDKRRGGMPDWLPVALSAGAGIATAVGESVYYWIKLGVAPGKVLAANLVFTVGPRPAWIVAAICLGLVLAGLARQRLPRVGKPAPEYS
jgi:sulfoxide reductase heme-binding subunit YedZ